MNALWFPGLAALMPPTCRERKRVIENGERNREEPRMSIGFWDFAPLFLSYTFSTLAPARGPATAGDSKGTFLVSPSPQGEARNVVPSGTLRI